VTKQLLFATAAAALSLASAAVAQPKPVARADYMKNVDTRFGTMDTNHDGKLSKTEVAAEQQRELQQAKARIGQQLQAKFKQLDTNKDGQLSQQEFMAASPPLRASETPEQMVARFDSNHDGAIGGDEFRTPELAKFNRVDANHDGIVTPAEIQAANKK
jgi:hypothetical protein